MIITVVLSPVEGTEFSETCISVCRVCSLLCWKILNYLSITTKEASSWLKRRVREEKAYLITFHLSLPLTTYEPLLKPLSKDQEQRLLGPLMSPLFTFLSQETHMVHKPTHKSAMTSFSRQKAGESSHTGFCYEIS